MAADDPSTGPARADATPSLAIWMLGLTQIVGYGTLFYSFPILAPAMAAEFGLTEQWVFGFLSLALFLGSLLAPTAGRLADRFGAGMVMAWGSAGAALALAACAFAPGQAAFAAALAACQLAACFVLYATAFVAIVQIAGQRAQRSITHLTLIAGFASTLFWPLTTWLHEHLSWREVYLLFAAVNLFVCLPAHAWLARLSRRRAAAAAIEGLPMPDAERPLGPAHARAIFPLVLAAFAIEGFVLSSILVHMVPLLGALGLGAAGVLVSTLFGPSQVGSRLVNMAFGGRLRQTVLALVASSLLASGLLLLVTTAPWAAGVTVFVVLFGMGSGLNSIIGGTLPLELFGRDAYGARVGWASAARQFSSSFAPFVFAMLLAKTSTTVALWTMFAVAATGLLVFALIAWLHARWRTI